MAADDPRDGDSRPVPDPTRLTTEQLRRELSSLREILQARLDGNDRAMKLAGEAAARIPAETEKQIRHLQELAWERFSSIALQFKERDERSTQLAKSSSDALEAALKAAKELGVAQTEANVQANAKTEVAFAQQLKAVADKIDVINQRLDKGEGSSSGTALDRTERRLDLGQVIMAVSVIAAVIGLIIVAFRK